MRLLPRIFRLSVLINFIGIYVSKILRLTRVRGMPYLVMIEPTSRCNLRCPMCGRTSPGLNRPQRDMSLQEFKSVFDQLKSRLVAVGLWNFGEPLLIASLFDMIRIISRERIFSIVLTNGTLLDRKKAGAAVGSGLDYLGISLDGASEDTYNKYRPGGEFGTLLENIKYLVEEKKRRHSSTPFIEIIFLVMRENEHEISRMQGLARELGVNKLSFKKVSFGRWGEFIDLSGFLPSDRRFVHALHRSPPGRLKKYCIAPWLQATVNADGSVIPCCGGYLAETMGNVFGEKFSEIWNGRKFEQFREQLKNNIDAVESCLHCAERSYDTEVFVNTNL